ncbi:hypothetical protein [Pedobacter nototheniae]|nr:hypothetical protein [Pedobacter nototheniae]
MIKIKSIEFKTSSSQDINDFRSFIKATKALMYAIAVKARNKSIVCIPNK